MNSQTQNAYDDTREVGGFILARYGRRVVCGRVYRVWPTHFSVRLSPSVARDVGWNFADIPTANVLSYTPPPNPTG